MSMACCKFQNIFATPYSWAVDHSRWSTEPNRWICKLSELCGWDSSCLLLQTAIIATDNSLSKLRGFQGQNAAGEAPVPVGGQPDAQKLGGEIEQDRW
jgi:hypothetical protein